MKLNWKDILKWLLIVFVILAVVLGLTFGTAGIVLGFVASLVVVMLSAVVIDFKGR